MFFLFSVFVIIIIILCTLGFNLIFKSALPLPPGPRGSVLSGAQSQLPKTKPWRTYAQWSDQYAAPLISFRVYNKRTIVLNSRKVIHELLNRRAHIYSDRPKSWMYHVLCDRQNSVFNISSSHERYRRYRKLLQAGLGPRALPSYSALLEAEVSKLLDGFRRSPTNWQKHVRRNATAVVMKMAYGYDICDENDFFIGVAEEVAQISGYALAPGRWMVDYLPFLRYIPSWFPGAHYKRQGEAWRVRLQDLSDVPHRWVQTQVESGRQVDSFTSRLLRPDGNTLVDPEEEDIIKWTAGGLYAGATDTTISAIISFVLLMSVHPDVQRRAQQEIDGVLRQRDRIDQVPQASDLVDFSYLLAVLKEVLRYAPVSNLALPHMVTQDDEYDGYGIPAGTTIMANVWAVTHDPATYPEPDMFNPDRFVEGDETEVDQQPDPRVYCFGYGRRTCPGLQFAENTMLLTMAGILSKFNISYSGKDMPEIDFTTALTSHIVPFDIKITLRSFN